MPNPNLAVLRRRDGSVQVGADPERALVLHPTTGLGTDALVRLLGHISRGEHPDVAELADLVGTTPKHVRGVLAVLTTGPTRTLDIGPIQILGDGPLADITHATLRRLGHSPRRCLRYRPGTDITRWRARFVVLADALVPDPGLAERLVLDDVTHLTVRVRDDRGLVGPLVVPGRTSCLRCADLTRRDQDDEWPYLAAQLLGRHGRAHPTTVSATAALAVGQLTALGSGVAAESLPTANATLEVDLDAARIDKRPWPRHPECGCAPCGGALTDG